MAKRKLGVNHMTLRKKTIYHYDEAVNEPCRIVLVKVCEVLLKGTPFLDKYDELTVKQKKSFNFDYGQKKKIRDKLPLKDMDISLLEKIIEVTLWCVGPICFLLHSCKEFKVHRNTLAHDKPILSLTREQLKEEIKKLRDLCEQILEELKKYCDDDDKDKDKVLIRSLDPLMKDIDDELQSLEKIEWDDSDIRKSARKELESFLDKKCLIDTAEGYDGSHQVSPDSIITEFLMVTVKEERLYDNISNETNMSKKIEYQQLFKVKTKDNKSVDVIVITGDGGIGKTTCSKYTASEFCKTKTNIQELLGHTLLLYMECRDTTIDSLDSLLKNLFPITLKEKCSEDIEKLKSFINRKKIITIIDGYDEVNNDTDKVVQEILQLQKLGHTIITTRQGHVNRLKGLVTNKGKQYVIFQLLGILPEHYGEFISKQLAHLMKDKTEEERVKTCEELLCTLNKLRGTLGKVLNTPMILSNLTHIKVEMPKDMEHFGNTTDVYESFRKLKKWKIHKRMQDKVPVAVGQELETCVIPMLMKIHDQLAVKTFMDKQYEFREDVVSELKKKCNEFGLPSDHILSTFFSTNVHYNGSGDEVKMYKYLHLTDQEFAVAKHLGRLIKKRIMNDSSQDDNQISEITNMIEESIIWKYLNGSKDEKDLIQNKSQISRFRYVILFLIGEMSRIQKNDKISNIFEKFSDKLINIGWHLSDSIELSNINYGEDNSSDSIEDHDNDNKKTDAQQSKEDDEQDKLKYEEFVQSEEMKENIEPSTDSNTDVKKQEDDDEEENDEFYRFGREDMALKYLTESKSDEHMTHSVISKFDTKKTWNIVNGESFSALNLVLETIKPQKLVVSIDTDPTLFSDFHQTISLLIKKEIETELYLHGHYHKEISGFSNDWVKRGLNLKEFIGCLNEEGIENLPETLKTLHLAVDHTVLVALNNRLKELKELSFLGLRINLKSGVKNVPCLSSYTGDEMCLTLASDIDDEFALWVADITKQIICQPCPNKQNMKLKGLWLQETHLTGEGIGKILNAIHSKELKIIGQLKIWTKEKIKPEEKEELNHQAIDMGLGGVIVYDILANAKEGSRPKTMEKGRSDINSINPDLEQAAEQSGNLAEENYQGLAGEGTIKFDPMESQISLEAIPMIYFHAANSIGKKVFVSILHTFTEGRINNTFKDELLVYYGLKPNKRTPENLYRSEFTNEERRLLEDPSISLESLPFVLIDKLLRRLNPITGLAFHTDVIWTQDVLTGPNNSIEYLIYQAKYHRNVASHYNINLSVAGFSHKLRELEHIYITLIERVFEIKAKARIIIDQKIDEIRKDFMNVRKKDFEKI